MKMVSGMKRVSAVMLCLALLCGILAGSFPAYVAAAQTDVQAAEKYAVDFSELAALVDAEQYAADTGRYQPTIYDDAINAWADDHFTVVLNREGAATCGYPKKYLGQSSFALATDGEGSDGWGGEHHWEIDKAGYLYHSTGKVGGEMARKGEALVLKTADGAHATLANMEITVTFNTLSNERGMLYVAMHDATEGVYPYNSQGSPADVIAVANNGSGVDGMYYNWVSQNINGNGYHNTLGETFSGTLSANSDYTLYIKALGATLYVKVTDANGSTVYEATKENTLTERLGYLSVGTTNAPRSIKSITVIELDENGNAIDFGTNTPDHVETFEANFRNIVTRASGGNYAASGYPWYTFGDSDHEDANIIEYYLNKKFDLYYTNQGIYRKVTAGQKQAYDEQTSDYAYFDQLYDNWMLQRQVYNLTGHQNFRLISSLVPRSEKTGEAYQMKNFEMSFRVYFEKDNEHYGTVMVGFRQQEPGKFVDGYFNVDKDQGFVAITRYGITAAGGEDIYSENGKDENGNWTHDSAEGDMYNSDQTVTFDETLPKSSYITVKVVGEDCWVSIYGIYDGYTALYRNEEPFTINYDKVGYVALGVASDKMSIGDITLTRLDENGNPVDIDPTADSADTENGTLAVSTVKSDREGYSKYVVKPQADEGYQLKAGSLVVTAADGSVILPERVGFRETDDATQYVFYTKQDVTVSAEFFQPTTARANVGNVGTSINEQTGGLRFIGRLNRRVKYGTTEYVTLGDKQYLLVDYGMLIGTAAVIGSDELTLELAESNTRVKVLSAKQRRVYYDICDEYIEMAARIDGIVAAGAEDVPITARAYAVALVDGEEVALYEDAFTSTYAANLQDGATTATFADLVAADKIQVLGRAAVSADEYQMDWANAGFAISGKLSGSVGVTMSSTRTASLLNVTVDGGEPTVVTVPKGVSTVILAEGLDGGEHTIEVISGTSLTYNCPYTAVSLHYTGELHTVTADTSRLQMEVLGDSITCSWLHSGRHTGYIQGYDISVSNTYYSYAAQAARALDADLQVVAQCGATIEQVNNWFPYVNKRNKTVWDFENDQQDVVVINLGTNDELKYTADGNADYSSDLTLERAKALLDDVRAAYPDAHIIWVYGMMCKEYEAVYQSAVQYMQDKNDAKVWLLEMEANTEGGAGHPDLEAHTAAGEKLAAFVRENCMD